MSMGNLGPYTNFHELNQDWFLQEFKIGRASCRERV